MFDFISPIVKDLPKEKCVYVSWVIFLLKVKAAERDPVTNIFELWLSNIVIEDLFEMREITIDCLEVRELLADFEGHIATASTNIS